MKCVKLVSKGAIRLVPVTDQKSISDKLNDGYTAIMKNGKPVVVEFNGQEAITNNIGQSAVDLLKLIEEEAQELG